MKYLHYACIIATLGALLLFSIAVSVRGDNRNNPHSDYFQRVAQVPPKPQLETPAKGTDRDPDKNATVLVSGTSVNPKAALVP